jgi:hypothetical protein
MNEAPNRFEKHAKVTLAVFIVLCIIILDLIAGFIFLKRPNKVDLRIPSPYYHHDLVPNFSGEDEWGGAPHPIFTDNLGFKDREVRDVPLTTDKHRILFMGDSFTEGIGEPYEKTFVAKIQDKLEGQSYDILNAGVASYSPRLYYLKTKYLIEHGLKFDELVVFSDISDAQDEINYASWTPSTDHSLLTLWQKYSTKVDHFFEHRSLIYLHLIRPTLFGVTWQRIHTFIFGTETKDTSKEKKYVADRGRWTFDDEVYKDWGEKGAASEINYMGMLYDLCKKNGIKMSIVVYPWPITIQNKDANSRQVSLWQDFVKGKDVEFYNLFPPFFATTTPYALIYKTYFIEGDVHWNEAGHTLIANEWLKLYSKSHGIK